MDSDEDFRRRPTASPTGSPTTSNNPERFPVLSRVRPGRDPRARSPRTRPSSGEAFDAIFADFERIILPGVTHWNHPGFFAYFAITSSAPGVLAEFLSAALNQQAMLWRTSPAATELEEVALAGCAQLIGLPDAFEGVIYDTASISTLHALAAAREAAVPGRARAGPRRARRPRRRARLLLRARALVGRQGGDPARPRARRADAGFRRTRDFRMRPDAAGATRSPRDRAAGALPIAVVATVGTTSTHERRSGRRDRGDLRARAASGCTSTPRTPASPRWCRATSGSCAARRAPTRSSSTRTSGCSRRSISSVLYCRRMDVAAPGVLADARVPEDERRRRRRPEPDGHRHPARTPVPRAEAVDGPAALRRRGTARARSPSTCGSRGCSPRGSTRAIASSASRRCPSASSASACAAMRPTSEHAAAARRGQRVGRSVPLAHEARRALRAPPRHRQPPHDRTPRARARGNC